MFDKVSGKVAYADLSFGGFLGIGDRHHPLLWSLLNYDTKLDGYVVNLDKDLREKASNYGEGDPLDREDENFGRIVYDYYGIPPYWM